MKKEGATLDASMVYGVCVEDWVSVSLRIPGLGRDAARPHGHDYRVRVCIEGPLDASTGVVLDHGALHAMLRRCLGGIDYRSLNEALDSENATAELLAYRIGLCISRELGSEYSLVLVSACTPRGYCSYVRKPRLGVEQILS